MTVNETKRGDMPKVKDAMTFCDRFAKIVDKHVMLGKRCVNKTLNLHSLSHARAQEIHFDKSRPANKRNYFEGKGVSEMAARVGRHMVSRPPPSIPRPKNTCSLNPCHLMSCSTGSPDNWTLSISPSVVSRFALDSSRKNIPTQRHTQVG
jgi:hypothetical protein